MTRYTNVSRKRTYLQATFDPNDDQKISNVASTSSLPSPVVTPSGISNGTDAASTAPATSRHKRRRKNKRNSEGKVSEESGPGPAADPGDGSAKNSRVTKSERTKKKAPTKPMTKVKAKRVKSAADSAASTDARRFKRIAERDARTTCFACRGLGHSAKHCPTIARPEDDGNGDGDSDGGKPKTGTPAAVVGICYRCGSRKHNLARCPTKRPARPEDGFDPLPFASCFVCFGRGHLASSCPKNDGKGVYPNGGSCKLCGETTHLARDCTLRKIGGSMDGGAVAALLGTGREAGADEDDFHAIRRKNVEMDRDERGEERTRKEAKVRAGALTGVVKAFGKAPAMPKNVVYF